MRCCECEAAREYQTRNIKCRAGIHPYIQNSSKKLGCSCTKKQVQKYMKEEPQTNSDRIRAMSDEELGVFLGDWAANNWYWRKDGRGQVLLWLQGEAED